MPLALFGLVLAVVVMLLFGGTQMDRGLLILVAQVDAPHVKSTAAAVAWVSQPLPLLILTAAAAAGLLLRQAWRRALLLAAVVAAGWAVIALMQQATAALRPGLEERVLASQGAAGFPDGDVARATLVLIALPLLLAVTRPARPLLGTAGAFLALAIGWSRILLGLTWPSDVVAGWGVALLCVVLTLRLAGYDIGDGTPRRLSSDALGEESLTDDPRARTARGAEGRDLIERQ